MRKHFVFGKWVPKFLCGFKEEVISNQQVKKNTKKNSLNSVRMLVSWNLDAHDYKINSWKGTESNWQQGVHERHSVTGLTELDGV